MSAEDPLQCAICRDMFLADDDMQSRAMIHVLYFGEDIAAYKLTAELAEAHATHPKPHRPDRKDFPKAPQPLVTDQLPITTQAVLTNAVLFLKAERNHKSARHSKDSQLEGNSRRYRNMARAALLDATAAYEEYIRTCPT